MNLSRVNLISRKLPENTIAKTINATHHSGCMK
jgi:hypothetical protein